MAISSLGQLGYGMHSCLVYDTLEQQAAMTADFIRVGRERSERCIFLGSPEKLAAVRTALTGLGLDVESLEKKGDIILSSQRPWSTDDPFKADSTIAYLKKALEQALADGFLGLRAAGDVHWEMGPDQNFSTLADYESRLDEWVPGSKMIGLCQYPRRMDAAEAIPNALRTHETVILGERVCLRNPYYELSSIRQETDKNRFLEARSEWWFEQIRRSMDLQLAREDARRESENRFSMMVAEIKDYAIFMLDKNGYITTWNEGAARIKGYREKEIVGRHFSVFYTPEDLKIHKPQQLLAEAVSAGRVEQEGWRLRKDGSRFWANIVITALHDSQGSVRGFAKITRDLTDRRKIEEELRLKNEELMQSRKIEAVGLLAGGVAHDFNNLLAGILGCTEILLASAEPAAGHIEELTEIQQATQRAMTLTKQLLAFGRRQVIQPTPTNLNTIISGLSSMLRRLIREDIHLQIALDPTLEIIKADHSQLEQIIVNLVINARDAMPKGGTLLIETKNHQLDSGVADRLQLPAASYIVLTIADTGVGMTPEVRAKIFEPFFTTKKEGAGTGLGLATVHGIVKQNHGAINVYTEVGKGTTFKIWLPSLKQETTAHLNPSMKPDGVMPHGTETILIVEDEPVVSNYVSKTLRNLGYTVLVAADADEAMKMVERSTSRIDLLLTDVILPRINGRELAHKLLTHSTRTKLVYMSGYPAEIIGQHGVLDAGIAFLEKPFNAFQLALRVRKSLDTKE